MSGREKPLEPAKSLMALGQGRGGTATRACDRSSSRGSQVHVEGSQGQVLAEARPAEQASIREFIPGPNHAAVSVLVCKPEYAAKHVEGG